jgi:hypothetical protein
MVLGRYSSDTVTVHFTCKGTGRVMITTEVTVTPYPHEEVKE